MKRAYSQINNTAGSHHIRVFSDLLKLYNSRIKIIYLVKSSVLMLMLALGVLSCTKDKSENHFNYFEVGTELKVQLTKGVIIDYGLITDNPGTVYHLHADLLDDGINYNPLTNEFSGAGNRVNIEFNSPENGHLTSGTYSFDPVEGQTNIFTFHTGFIEENIDYALQTGHHHDITEGTIIVIYDPGLNNYDIIFDCLLSTGNRLVGSFKGPLIYSVAPTPNM